MTEDDIDSFIINMAPLAISVFPVTDILYCLNRSKLCLELVSSVYWNGQNKTGNYIIMSWVCCREVHTSNTKWYGTVVFKLYFMNFWGFFSGYQGSSLDVKKEPNRPCSGPTFAFRAGQIDFNYFMYGASIKDLT